MRFGGGPSRPTVARGTRHAWKGGWGVTSDKRSKLMRRTVARARKLAAEEFDVTKPGVLGSVNRLAQTEVLAEKTYDTLDVDPKATRRIWSGLVRASLGIRAELLKMNARRQERVKTVLELLAEAEYEPNGRGTR